MAFRRPGCRTARTRVSVPSLAAALLVVLAACGSGGGSASVESTGAPGTDGGTSGTGPVVTVGGGGGSTAAPGSATETLPEATTTLVGVVVGGNGGGEGPGQTDTLSEMVREQDGSCAGWAGPGGSWTAEVKEGAPVQIFDAAQGGRLLAKGALAAGTAEDADPPNGQWQCSMKFSIDSVPKAAKYYVQVASLARVEARPDPSGALVVPVSTAAKADKIESCRDPNLPGSVGQWDSVGQYWSQGLPSICGAGLRVNRLERVCRPKAIATDRIVSVVEASSGTVYEDASGLKVDPSQLKPGTVVTVRVTTAYPCG